MGVPLHNGSTPSIKGVPLHNGSTPSMMGVPPRGCECQTYIYIQINNITRIGVYPPPPPFWLTEKSLSIAFRDISDQYTIFVLNVFHKNIAENHFWSHFSPFQINMQLFFSQNGCRRPFWMTENHFRSHFSTFQINTQLFFSSQNGFRRPFWMTENHFWSHFSPFQINTPAAILEVRFAPKTIGFFHYVLSMAMPNILKLVGEFMTQLERRHKLYEHVYTKWPPEAILFFRLMPKIIRFL